MDIEQLIEKTKEAKKALDYLKELGLPTTEALNKFLSKEVEPFIMECLGPIVECLGEDLKACVMSNIVYEHVYTPTPPRRSTRRWYLKVTFPDGVVYNSLSLGAIKNVVLRTAQKIGIDRLREECPWFILDEEQHKNSAITMRENAHIPIPNTSLYVCAGSVNIAQVTRNLKKVLETLNLQNEIKVEITASDENL